jgi:hypothetical protein
VPGAKTWVVGGLIALAGCGYAVPTAQQVAVSGSRFPAVSEDELTVRVFLLDPAGGRREVIGAPCVVSSDLYSTRLVAPARLVVPNFGSRSPELRFDCRANGRRGEAAVAIATHWRPPAFGYGAYGWEGPSYPVSEYPDVSVSLR